MTNMHRVILLLIGAAMASSAAFAAIVTEVMFGYTGGIGAQQLILTISAPARLSPPEKSARGTIIWMSCFTVNPTGLAALNSALTGQFAFGGAVGVPTPEPSSNLLFAIGLAAVALYAKTANSR